MKGYFACAHRNGSNACSSHVYRAAAAVQQLLRSLPTSNHVNVMIPVDNIIQRFINFSPFHLTTLSDVRPRHMRLRTNVSCRRLYCSDRRITAVLRLTLACVCEQPIGAFLQNCFPAISIAALFARTLFSRCRSHSVNPCQQFRSCPTTFPLNPGTQLSSPP